MITPRRALPDGANRQTRRQDPRETRMRGPSWLIGGIVFGAVLMVMLLAAPAFAQIQAGAGTCLPEVQASPEAQIKDCTAVIQGGQSGTEALSVALVIRGNAYA